MTFTPSFDLCGNMRLAHDLFFFSTLLQQYGNMYFGYTGDKASADYQSLESFVKNLYSSAEFPGAMDAFKIDTKTSARVKQIMITLDAAFGDHVWPPTAVHEAKLDGSLISKSSIDGIQLLVDLNLKVKYFKQYLAQLLTLNPDSQAADYNAAVDLCKSLYTYPYGSVDKSTTTQHSGIKQIVYVLDSLLGHGYFPSNTQ